MALIIFSSDFHVLPLPGFISAWRQSDSHASLPRESGIQQVPLLLRHTLLWSCFLSPFQLMRFSTLAGIQVSLFPSCGEAEHPYDVWGA